MSAHFGEPKSGFPGLCYREQDSWVGRESERRRTPPAPSTRTRDVVVSREDVEGNVMTTTVGAVEEQRNTRRENREVGGRS